MNDIINIGGVDCYEKDGTAYLKLEAVARGLGFTRVATSGNEVVRWERVEGYLKELGVPTSGHDGFIPENIFYRLAMKAKNAAAEAFQAKIADEVIPSIRKHGAYITSETVDRMIESPEFGIKLPICNAEPPQDKKHQKEGKGAYGKGIVFAVFAVLEKLCSQHFVSRSDAANEKAGDNTESGAEVPILRAPKCD